MITKDQYNQLVEKIVEAVPEIMELKMGCQYEWGKSKKILVNRDPYRDFEYKCGCTRGRFAGAGFTNYRCGYCKKGFSHSDTGTPRYCANCARKHEKCQYCKAHLKIIGRPIQLADVMRAINSLGDTKKTYAISQEGKFFSVRYIPVLLDYEVEYYTKWDLSLPLDQQNDEVKEFLYNLLVK